MDLTIFSTPKKLKGEQAHIQWNAITSWTQLNPNPQILLISDEHGVGNLASDLMVEHIKNIKTNSYGTPLVNNIFSQAMKKSRNNVLCYVNSDIIIDPRLMMIIDKIYKEFKNPLIVSRRWNLQVESKINFNKNDWFDKISNEAQLKKELYPKTGIDLFIFNKNLFFEIPPFAVGRTCWDNWLLYEARKRGATIIDITSAITLIHQNHSHKKFHTTDDNRFKKGIESKENLKLAKGFGYLLTLDDADFHLSSSMVLIKKTKSSFESLISKIKLLTHRLFDKYIYLR